MKNDFIVLVHYLRLIEKTKRKYLSGRNDQPSSKKSRQHSPSSSETDSLLISTRDDSNQSERSVIPSPPPIEQFLASLGETWTSEDNTMNEIGNLHNSSKYFSSILYMNI